MNGLGDGSDMLVSVKIERQDDGAGEGYACPTAAGLYAEHEVKDDLVLGPERLQPQDVAYEIPRLIFPAVRRIRHDHTYNGEMREEDSYAAIEQKSNNGWDAVPRGAYSQTVTQEPAEPPGAETGSPAEAPRPGQGCTQQAALRTCFVRLERILVDELHLCETCLRIFVQKFTLMPHICIFRGKSVRSEGILEESQEKNTFLCDNCGKPFLKKSYLAEHQLIHAGEKHHTCDVSKKQFIQRSTLSKHRLIHTGVKPYTCDVCKKQFLRNSSLVVHRVVHAGEKSCTCDICKKQFSDKSGLAKHRLIHTGEKRYTCDVCKKHFSSKSSLAKHCFIHTGVKPYTCDVCKKQFLRKSSLAVHRIFHTGEKPYTCDVCKKQFSDKSG